MARGWMRSSGPLPRERGIAVVVALLVLALLSIMGISLINLSLTEGLIGSNESDLKKAFFAAEAGIQEAMYRIRLDPGAFTNEANTACSATADPVVIGQQGTPAASWANPTGGNFWYYNPLSTPTACPGWSYTGSSAPGYGNYFGGNAANLDSAGRTFTSSGAAHAAGGQLASANLTNTASDARSYSVTVAPVVGYVGGCWQYVDQFGVPLGSCLSVAQNPMFKVTSTGTVGPTGGAERARKVISAMIQGYPIKPKLDGTLTANSNVNVQSAAAVIDGRNYDCDGNNPSGTDSKMAATTPTGTPGISVNNNNNLQCNAGTGVSNCGGTSSSFPDTIGALLLGPNATTKDISALNAYLESIKVPPANAPPKTGSAFHGILYVDGNYEMPPDGSTGILIVHHTDATNNNVATLGNFNGGTFKGLIIADGINQINGAAQIIGGVFAFGANAAVNVSDIAGTPNIKYSKCQIDKLSQIFPYRIVSGTWHEQ